MPKPIRFNAFQMNTVGHQSPGLWPHPRDTSYRYTSTAHWVELAKLLEQGRFDALFLADVLGAYDVYEGSHASALTYVHPYTFARRMSTLDHLSGGRVGWNIVTGYLDSATRKLGLARQPGHDERYDLADEYLEVVYKLWEKSWDDDAVLRDKVEGVVADPARVHPIRHQGRHYTVPGIHLCEPSPQRTPLLYQAGTSARDVVELAVPELQRRGRYRKEYSGGTLRSQLHGRGDRLPLHHPGRQVSIQAGLDVEAAA